MSDRIVLDWRRHPIGRRPGKCRLCGKATLLRDESNRPCHKVCAEDELAARAARAVATHARRDRT